jgi:very-short-patch-repair endonuclease/DNA polymerase III delta prime subunit
MAQSSELLRTGRGRITQIFQFLEALHQLRNPAKRLIREQPWLLWLRDLPAHESIQIGVLSEVPPSEVESTKGEARPDHLEGDEFILRVGRPKLTRAPIPPSELLPWLHPGWDSVEGAVEVHGSRNAVDERGETVIEQFDDEPARPELLKAWMNERDGWARNERPSRLTMQVFERLYELHGTLEREAEKLEVVIGDGILNWRRPDGDVHHPVLLQRLHLEFDPEVPHFTLRESERGPELYTALFRSMPEVDGRVLAKIREQLDQIPCHPLGGSITSGFLRNLVVQIHASGEFVETGEPKGIADHPRLGRDTVIFTRSRTLGFANALEAVLEDLQKRDDLPPALLNVVGLDPESHDEVDPLAPPSALAANEHQEFLLSKSANAEQLRIAEQVTRYGRVLVQGPPGTGKTHTIANLIGHLLSQGKSVLVTSQTTKALRVLHEQIVEELRPLCVSVVGTDLDSKKQLETSVEGIGQRLSSSDAVQLENDAIRLRSRRESLIKRIQTCRQQLFDARTAEYTEVIVAGVGYQPSGAARLVAEGTGVHDWIPGSVSLGEPAPLSQAEVSELYALGTRISPHDEDELARPLPSPPNLISASEFERYVESFRKLDEEDLQAGVDLWSDGSPGTFEVACPKCGLINRVRIEWTHRRPICGKCRTPLPPAPEETRGTERLEIEPESLELLADRMIGVAGYLENAPAWKLDAVEAGRVGGAHREPWDNLIRLVEAVSQRGAEARETLLRYRPRLAEDIDIQTQVEVFRGIERHLRVEKGLGFWSLFTRSQWKQVITSTSVNESAPRLPEHFAALVTHCELTAARAELRSRWDAQVVPLGGPAGSALGEQPEVACTQFISPLKDALQWHARAWKPLQDEMTGIGFRWDEFLLTQAPNLTRHGELLRIKDAVVTRLSGLVVAEANRRRRIRLEIALAHLTKSLDLSRTNKGSATVIEDLHGAVTERDTGRYREAFRRLVDLDSLRSKLTRREELLRRLEATAPDWAGAIRARAVPHAGAEPPGDVIVAWLWRQLDGELTHRERIPVERLQRELEQCVGELKHVTTELIDRLAWGKQIRRIGLAQRQSLMGWLQTVRKIGKGTGKRVPRLRAEARRLMGECRSAVPAWIMPLSAAVENFDPRETRFDVVIIDEASQSDAMALLAFYMGRDIVVVGDHEQVSPEAVGQRVDEVQHLIDEHLHGIPNGHLYDGRTSIYDIAGASFGGVVRLREHFRCVREIIEFSNNLSYNGDIKPLRDSSRVRPKPHVVAYRAGTGPSADKVNLKEARAVASLLVASVEQPEFSLNDKGQVATFGVCSLVGDEQAREIDTLLQRHMPPVEYDRRRVVCGGAAHFQGDERDVMFLSIVDGPQEGPLALREQPLFKKRFNVAASRARDQMWIVHSLDPSTDLKQGDLRRRLIEYSQDPVGFIRQLDEERQRTESPFEKDVLNRLIAAGYRVVPQLPVGHYRIDLVVEGNSRRLAIECDGDRYHPPERLHEDLERQAILERLGWMFERIRGSVFFRNPDRAMNGVFRRLRELEIPPEGPEPGVPDSDLTQSELVERIIRRAAELRKEWEAHGDQAEDSADWRSTSTANPPRKHDAAPDEGEEKSREQPTREAGGSAAIHAHNRRRDDPKFPKPERASPGRKPSNTSSDESRAAETRPNPKDGTPQLAGVGSRGPIAASIAQRLSPVDWICKACGRERKLWIGRKGPFLQCNGADCGKTESVPTEIVVKGLEESQFRCEKCGTALQLAHGQFGSFVGCQSFPKCDWHLSWKALQTKVKAL